MTDPLDTGKGGPPAPERTLFTSKAEYNHAADRLLAIAENELRVFDPDFGDFRLEVPARIEALRHFLRRGLNNRLYIAVHDPDSVQRYCPRLVALLGTFSGRILINRTLGEAARVQDCFILADKVHVLRRPVATQGRGVFILNDPRECLGMLGRFEEIWGSSEPGVSANSTGL